MGFPNDAHTHRIKHKSFLWLSKFLWIISRRSQCLAVFVREVALLRRSEALLRSVRWLTLTNWPDKDVKCLLKHFIEHSDTGDRPAEILFVERNCDVHQCQVTCLRIDSQNLTFYYIMERIKSFVVVPDKKSLSHSIILEKGSRASYARVREGYIIYVRGASW